jgi:hypothetical protein
MVKFGHAEDAFFEKIRILWLWRPCVRDGYRFLSFHKEWRTREEICLRTNFVAGALSFPTGTRWRPQMHSGIDERARAILFRTYWSAEGWRPQPSTPPADAAYALAAGYLFAPETISHDALVHRVQKALRAVSLADVWSAFLASLSTRRLDLRSAFGSYAVAHHLPLHAYEDEPQGRRCRICGNHDPILCDWSVLNFERHKWGGVRHTQLGYMAFDLEQLAQAEPVTPTREDQAIFQRILQIAGYLPPHARLSDLVRAMAPVLPSNQAERRVLLELLGYWDLLIDPAHPGFSQAFIVPSQRDLRAGDWAYPVCWWRGRHGVNKAALAAFSLTPPT